MTKTHVIASLQGNAKTISRLIGGAIGANGKITVDNITYDGIPYHELPAQMTDARQCRKEIAYSLMESRSQIIEHKKSTSHVSPYSVKRNGYDVFLMSKPNFKAFIALNINRMKIHRLMDGTKINLIGSELTAQPKEIANMRIAWRKVEISAGEFTGAIG
jgi:hypothetical protein